MFRTLKQMTGYALCGYAELTRLDCRARSMSKRGGKQAEVDRWPSPDIGRTSSHSTQSPFAACLCR